MTGNTYSIIEAVFFVENGRFCPKSTYFDKIEHFESKMRKNIGALSNVYFKVLMGF